MTWLAILPSHTGHHSRYAGSAAFISLQQDISTSAYPLQWSRNAKEILVEFTLNSMDKWPLSTRTANAYRVLFKNQIFDTKSYGNAYKLDQSVRTMAWLGQAKSFWSLPSGTLHIIFQVYLQERCKGHCSQAYLRVVARCYLVHKHITYRHTNTRSLHWGSNSATVTIEEHAK